MKHTPGGPMHEGSYRKGGKDPHAHSSHHEHNKEHGMADGFCPKEECCHSPGESREQGGEGMAHNAKHENDTTPSKAID